MALTPRERTQIVDQILRIAEGLFVHRRMKTALYGIDPVTLLHGLRNRAANMSDTTFHRELRTIVNQFRDRHTRYTPPDAGPPYELPLKVIEKAYDGDKAVYLVTQSQDSRIPVGSELLRWNGVPLEFVIRELSEEVGAGNEAARRALALAFLAKRPPARFDPPVEQEVRLDIRLDDNTMTEVIVAWSPAPSFVPAMPPTRALTLLGVDFDLLTTKQRDFELLSNFAELSVQRFSNVQADVVEHKGMEFGRLRIFNFLVDDPAAFVAHVAELLRGLPARGLIIDLRGNPGGNIKTGESLLQLFTGPVIRPHGFRFRASDATEYMLGRSRFFDAWASTVEQGVRLGAEHSATYPIEGVEGDFNKIGRVYPGPSVLIVDALTYSTGDMFTAGYQDHAIGEVICTDENVGAGGANNWTYDVLRAAFPGFLLPAAFETELERGMITTELRQAFEDNGQSLPADATVGPAQPDPVGTRYFDVVAGLMTYRIAKREWLREELAVHFAGDNPFVQDLPQGVGFGFSIRQAVRQRRSEGLVLEDEGIRADYLYRMSRKDVLAGNSDLNAFACEILANAK